MDASIELVILSIDDYDEIVALWERAQLKIRPLGRDSKVQIQQQLESQLVWFIGARCGESLVGVVMPSHDSRRGWINRLAVDPDYRQQGIGEALLCEAQDQLRARGLDVIAATIERWNAPSLGLVRKCGFVVDEEVLYASSRTNPDA
ncbi:MAG TPA: GNAT family N-acetyltransferase [Candidatus Lokiarchaeia archaeon]|nr:GNAT family N-acetyltransferase [Candidatus Lokiarchaeia archaeon]